MKIRILGDRVRLRLSQTEVERIGQGGSVSENTNFPNRIFSYRLVTHSGDPDIRAEYAHDAITISVNGKLATQWAQSDQVGLESASGSKLHILIEKDFQCLTDRSEDESDLFPNPNETC
ncbi:MAG: hypothetical protein H6608_06495 [Flavobacteriales bacterium]|nr:hypothetical protein [Bacteroidota bacterium]MCB9240758.1 hypothetical protein [Flavobacteriales bacterium]